VVICYFKEKNLTKRIEAYTFYDFIMKVQEAVKEGWCVDPNDSEGYPQAHTGFYRCGMHRQEKIAALLLPKQPALVVEAQEPERETVTQEFTPSLVFTVQEDVQPVKRAVGRTKSNSI
jgi:hypothetical protein